MKPILLFLLLFSINLFGFAQEEIHMGDDGVYAVINDSDGFTNVRTSPNNKGSISGKIYSYHVFMCEANKTNWWKVIYINRDNSGKPAYIEGYIYKTKIALLPEWKPIKTKSNQIRIRVNTATYLSKKHTCRKVDEYTYLIDGKRFWGTDGPIPDVEISSIRISINNISVILPVKTYNDLYEPHLETLSYTHGPHDTIYIRMDNSDGAGAYTIIWVIKDNKYFGRYIDDGNV